MRDSLPTPLDEGPDAPLDELRRREDVWHSTHRADALWPGLDAEVLQSAADEIGDAVAAVLRGERARLELPRPGTDINRRARAVGVAGLLTGVGALLGAWIERGQLEAEPSIMRVLARHLAHGRARDARIRAAVLPVLRRMERAGLAPGVIKGFHTANVYFPEPGARPFHDVDVVVPPDAIPNAEEILRDAGFVADVRVGGRRYKREWFAPDGRGEVWSHELWHVRSRWKLDLHDGLNFAAVMQNVRARQTPRFADLMRIDDVTLRVADANEAIAMHATHASTELYSHRLLRLVELVLVARRAASVGTLDWTAVETSLTERESSRFAFPMLKLAEQLAPGTVDGPVLERLSGVTTARARAVTSGLTPTVPILDTHFSLCHRLIWAAGINGTLLRLWRMIAPLEGADARGRLRTYRHRATRFWALLFSSRPRHSDSTRGD
jgi:hypothetical protein